MSLGESAILNIQPEYGKIIKIIKCFEIKWYICILNILMIDLTSFFFFQTKKKKKRLWGAWGGGRSSTKF